MPRVELHAYTGHLKVNEFTGCIPVTERLSVKKFVTLVHDLHKTDFYGFFFSFCFLVIHIFDNCQML